MDRKRAAAAQAVVADKSATVADADKEDSDASYGEERERFVKDLQRFHDARGTSITHWPCIGGRPLDLYTLYVTVIKLGGWEKVNNEELWPEVQVKLGITKACGNIDYGLRQIYIRYLHFYEKINHFGQYTDVRDDTVDGDETPGRRKTVSAVTTVSFSYNYQQHNMTEATREALGLPLDSSQLVSGYAKLERSLMSGLPNEVDFALNVFLLLSSEGKYVLKGVKGLHVIDCMLSYVGISGDDTLASSAYNSIYQKFLRFWHNSVADKKVKDLLSSQNLITEKGSALPAVHGAAVTVSESETETECDDYWTCSADVVGCHLGTYDAEGQRVLQVATILRNLSFEEENLDTLCANKLLFRFLMLCIHCTYGCIRQLALDTLSNIAVKLLLEPVDCRMTQLVFSSVAQCIASADKFEVMAALETVGRLSQVDMNEDAICSHLEDVVYEQMIALLMLHDIQIVVAALEALYQLSELGDVTTTRIAQVSAAVSILVDLLTLEVQSYGEECLAGSKVVEHVTSAGVNVVPVSQPTPAAPPPPPAATCPPVRPPPPQPAPPVVTSNTFIHPRLPVGAGGSQAVDNEAIACNWLQSQYECQPGSTSSMAKMELYKRYVSACSICGLQQIVNPTTFATCVRVAFPSAAVQSIERDGTSELIYIGVVPRMKASSLGIHSGQVGGSVASVVVRPVQSAVQQQPVINAVSTSVPVFSAPNFPTIHEALRSAARDADQSVLTVTTSAVTTATASVVPDPAVVKTLLASKLARNITQQQPAETNSSQAASNVASVSSQGTSNVSSVPSSSSLTFVSATNSPSASPMSAVTCAADIIGAATVSVAPAGDIKADTDKTDVALDSNGLTDVESSVSVTQASSCSTATASSCLANGHAKQFHDPSALMNGICSPVPSCSSEDQEPLHDVKVPKSPGFGNKCDSVVVNGDVVDTEADDDDDDDDDDGSDLDDCDGDVLVKAMMHADIIDCGGRPAVTNNSCDDDSHISADFLSGYIESTGEDVNSPDVGTGNQVSATDTSIGFDSETAAAVADLLHEAGMMADDETAAPDMSVSGGDNCLSYEDDAAVSVEDKECVVAATCDALSVATDDEAPASASVDSSVTAAVFDDGQLGSADVTQQARVPLDEKAQPQLVASSFVGLSSTNSAVVSSAAPALACVANAASASLAQLSSPLAVSSVPPATQLQNGVMVVPPHGISLPSGQFISGGTRLLIRPITSVAQAATSKPSLSGRPTQPSLAPALLPAVNAQSGSTVATSSSSALDGNSQLPVSSATVSTSAPPVRFVSSTTSQGQLIIQRAQLLSSASSPLIQRVIVPPTPRPIAMQSEGQMILQATQPNQQIGSRPVLLTQAPFPTGQLRVAGPGMQLVTASNTHVQSAATQIVLQSGHVISVQPQQPSTHDVPQVNQSTGQVQITAASNLPVLAAKPGSDQSTSSQTTVDGTLLSSSQPVIQVGGPQLSTSVKPSLRPLMSTSQQPVQIVGAPMQLRAGLVGLPAGTANASVILQHGGRPILLHSPNVGTAQHPSGYVVFRPGPLAVPSCQEQINNSAVSCAVMASSSSSSLGPDTASRKRPLPALSTTVTRPVRKKAKKDEDCGLPFICEWSGCQRTFESVMQMYQHVTKEHFETNVAPVQICRWSGCDNVPRQRWSLMTHLQDRHLSEASLRLACEQRKKSDASAQPPPPPIYPPNAALQAIRRFSCKPPFPELMDPSEGPLTKHVHLTSALIIRNLARYSSLGRSLLRRHEQLLSYIALSSAESSVAISHCLWELHIH